MINFIVLLLLSSFSVFAQAPNCAENNLFPEIESLAAATTQTVETTCKQKNDDSFIDLAFGCFSGGKNGVVSAIQSFIDILKLLIVDAPAWVWGESKDTITKLIAGDLGPAEMAGAIASLNLSSQSGIWDKAIEYWEAFKKFAGELKDSLVSEIKGFPCLPLYKQSQIVCRGVTEVFLMVLAPVKVVQGAKLGISTAKALKSFIAETKALNGLSETNLAGRLKLAADALKEAKAGKEIMKLRGSRLIETELPNGEKILQFEQIVKGTDGKMHKVLRDVPVDGKTNAIDANSAIGKEIMSEAVKVQAGQGSVVFVDVNHLGKVNYFKGGTKAGDDYLESVAESLRKSIRPGDMVFKNGGDELVIVLGTGDPTVVRAVSQRMINEVDKNPRVKQLFKQEVIAITEKYRGVKKSKEWVDLPDNVRNNLTEAEEALAKKNFPRFQEIKKKELQAELSEQATYRGSISVGSSLVKQDEVLADVLNRAEKQAAEVKARYKAGFGHDISKYKIDIPEAKLNRAPPIALEPTH